MSQVYCDTSLLVPMFISEATTTAVQHWLSQDGVEVVSSALTSLEFPSVVSRRLREGTLTRAEAHELIDTFESWQARLVVIPMDDALFAAARSLIHRFNLGLKAPDSLHLALVLRDNLSFATLDRRLRAAATAIGAEVIDIPASRG